MSWSRTVAAASCVVIGGQAGRESAVSSVAVRVPSRAVGDSTHFSRFAFCSGEGETTPAGGGRDDKEEDEDEEEDLGRCEEEDTVAPDEDEEWAVVEELDSDPLDVNEEAVLSVETCWFPKRGKSLRPTTAINR